MPSNHYVFIQSIPHAGDGRQNRLLRVREELAFALGRLDAAALRAWGGRSSGRLVSLTGQRIGGLAKLGSVVVRAGGSEVVGAWTASRQHRLSSHIGDRAAAAIDGTLALGRDGGRLVSAVTTGLRHHPRDTAPALLGAVLGFSAGSGGLDGDGGIPDLDLLFGIGAHRSALTHTLIVGIVAEGLLLALVDLSAEVQDRLPRDHDPLWDQLAHIGRPLAANLAIGTSAGLAWHLLVDALVEPAALRNLPLELPMEAHQAIIGASGAAEAVRAGRGLAGSVIIDPAQGPSTGRQVVDTVANAADQLATAARAALAAWRTR